MKKKSIGLGVVLVLVLLLVTAAAAVLRLTVFTPTPEGSIRIEYGGKTELLALDRLAFAPVQGTVVNGKGEERTVDAQGVPLSAVLPAAGVESFSSVTAVAEDEYSASVTAEETEEPDRVFLVRQEEGGVQMIVFGDENSRRNVSDVVRLIVQ